MLTVLDLQTLASFGDGMIIDAKRISANDLNFIPIMLAKANCCHGSRFMGFPRNGPFTCGNIQKIL